ncbi:MULTISPECIES: hypothetical protein [unclassified Acinetobacter]|uniref:hypothetical protein n=1 Tax=unclassified Acinetobacter TaxID=196816 RepID=UPI0035B861B5
MASFDLTAFDARHQQDIRLVAALENKKDADNRTQIQIGFWINDPEQAIIYPQLDENLLGKRQDYLWQNTCFELFIGIRELDDYREINLATNLTWQAYAFEEYRYPEKMPPQAANDIEVIDIQRTKFGLTALIDIQDFLNHFQISLNDIYFGVSAVIQTQQKEHYFALQHSGQQADFHNKRDWLAYL